jgi:hypothetical protein
MDTIYGMFFVRTYPTTTTMMPNQDRGLTLCAQKVMQPRCVAKNTTIIRKMQAFLRLIIPWSIVAPLQQWFVAAAPQFFTGEEKISAPC